MKKNLDFTVEYAHGNSVLKRVLDPGTGMGWVAEEKECGLALQMVADHLQKMEPHKAAWFGLLHLLQSKWKRKRKISNTQ